MTAARAARVAGDDRLAVSVEEAAALLGISRDLAYDLVRRNELPSVRLGRRVVVPRAQLAVLLARAASAALPIDAS